MPGAKGSRSEFDHDAYARTRPRDDFWGQIRRTVRGVPVSEEQIELIVGAIKASLALKADDVLLDLACGNGALSSRLFDACAGVLGVDLSEFMVSVAKEYFESAPRYRFLQSDALAYLQAESHPERFTKALCYGSFPYLSAEAAKQSLILLHDRFPRLDAMFIGNLPDRELASGFFTEGLPPEEELQDHRSAIGIWRSREQFTALAAEAGWQSRIQTMPAGFWAAHYRYDVLLTRRSPGEGA